MKVWVVLRKTLKLEPRRTSTDAGWTSLRSSGSMTMRPLSSSALMSQSERTIYITARTAVTPGTCFLTTRSMPCEIVTSDSEQPAHAP